MVIIIIWLECIILNHNTYFTIFDTLNRHVCRSIQTHSHTHAHTYSKIHIHIHITHTSLFLAETIVPDIDGK